MIGGFYTKEDSSNHQLVRTLNFDGTPNDFDPGAVVSLPVARDGTLEMADQLGTSSAAFNAK